MEKITSLFIVCGEPSGDLNAAFLVKEIKNIAPEINISAVGGQYLKEAGVNIIADIRDLSVIGLFDVLRKLPKFFALKSIVLKEISKQKPQAIILVDFSGFNLRLAKAINNKIPVIYYISPQVWASRQGRVKTIKKYISKIFVIFEFEKEFYKKFGIDAEFIGHPLLDIVKPSATEGDFRKKYSLEKDNTIFCLLPGSRKSEIEKIFPVMLEAAKRLQNNLKCAQFIVAKVPQVNLQLYYKLAKNYDLNLKFIENETYDCLKFSKFSLVASGTATLEAAIIGNPFVIVYKMNLLNYLLYRPLVKIPFIGMVNIVAKKKIIPEFIQFNATAQVISEEILRILKNQEEYARIKNELSQVKYLLGKNNAANLTAKSIINLLNSKNKV